MGDHGRLGVWVAVCLLFLVLVSPVVWAHPDLLLQIEELTQQLDQKPDDVDLLLKRGDLHRRHENHELARADFKRVREIQPDNNIVDWLAGRLEVESGHAKEGIWYLDRYLLTNPGHVIALQNRARGYLLLKQPLLAAQDFDEVIRVSDRPAPALFSASALALVAAGSDHFSMAMDVVRKGLEQFPSEILLTGIGTDISLAQSDTETAGKLINRLPTAIQKLQQWQTRQALLDCQTGHRVRAAEWFAGTSESLSGSGHTPGLLTRKWLVRLAEDPSPDNCQAAVIVNLRSY